MVFIFSQIIILYVIILPRDYDLFRVALIKISLLMTTTNKHRIKKLTAEKVQEFRDEIVKRDGQVVDLTNRGIESIMSLEGLQTATKLDLSHNKLTKLSQLKSVPRVTMLKLTDNKLSSSSLTEIQYLKHLVILNVGENLLTRIPFEVLRNLRTLKALVLNNNSISALDWIPKLPELNSLILSNNRISQIPQRIVDGLPSLKKISISHNLLEEIPNLSQLTGITELRLSHNRIKTIPAHLAQLKNLKVLELSHNLIDDWSGLEALSSLESLRQLNLLGNPICGSKLEVSTKLAKEDGRKGVTDGNDEDSAFDVIGTDSKKKSSESKEVNISEEEQQLKKAKKLDAKHKQYNFKMKRLFPHLVVRDAARVLDKRVHGYVAPPKELKKSKVSKSEEVKVVAGKRKRASPNTNGVKEVDIATSIEANGKDAEKLETKSIHKKLKREQLAVDKPTSDIVATFDSDEKAAKYLVKQVKTNKPISKDVNQVTPKIDAKAKTAVKDKIRNDKKDLRQPKEIASGVVVVKKIKRTTKNKSAVSKPLDLTQIDFTPQNMASNAIGSFIAKFMAPVNKAEDDTLTHLSQVAEGAKWRLDNDLPAHKTVGYHRHHQYTSPEGFPEVPRQYIVTTHSKDRNYATYAANSYSSAIAIQEEIKTRPF
ncbi:putative leucine-rich repeat domain superfamily [Plasmopara halstedii]